MDNNDNELLGTILDARDPEIFEDEDLGYEASNASQALVVIRRMFHGTPFEKRLDDAICVCDEVNRRCREAQG